jgi:hypothetical protein
VKASTGGELRGGARNVTNWRERDRSSACGEVKEATSEERGATTVVEDDDGARGARSAGRSVADPYGGVGDETAGERSAVAADRRK